MEDRTDRFEDGSNDKQLAVSRPIPGMYKVETRRKKPRKTAVNVFILYIYRVKDINNLWIARYTKRKIIYRFNRY